MDNPFGQFAPAPAVADTSNNADNTSNPFAQFAPKPDQSSALSSIKSDKQYADATADTRPRWEKAMSSIGDAVNAPFAGATEAIGNTVMGGVQGAAQLADKAGLTNNLGDKISALKADNDKDTEDYLKDKPITHALNTTGKAAGDTATFEALGGSGDAGYLKNAITGAGQGALQVANDAQDRLKNSALGSAAAAGGKALFDAGGKALGYTADALSPAAQKARDLVKKVLASDNIDPEALAKSMEDGQATGLPLVAADHAQEVSNGGARNVLGMLDASINTPGDAAAQGNALVQRANDRGNRIRDMYDQLLSSTTKRDINDSAFKQIQNEANPAYEASNSVKPVYNDAIKEGLQNPDVVSGIPLGIKIQQNEAYGQGTPFKPYDKSVMDYVTKVIPGERGTEAIPGVKNKYTGTYDTPPVDATSGSPDTLVHEVTPLETPNMRLLDAAKRGLDAKIDAETDPAGNMTTYGRSLVQVKNKFLQGVDEANPLYAEARMKYGTAASRNSAFDRGRNFTNEDPEDIQDFIHGNALRDKEAPAEADKLAYYSGARRNIEDLADNMNNSDNFGKRLWKEGWQKRMEAMLPSTEHMNTMNDLMGKEQNMADTDSVLGNSKTYRNAQFGQALQDAGSSKLAQNVAKAVKYVTHPIRATANAGSDMLQNAVKSSANKKTGDIASEVTKLLLSKDPAAIRSLSQNSASSTPAWLNAIPAASEGAEETTNEK